MYKVREVTQVEVKDVEAGKVYIIEPIDTEVIIYALKTIVEIDGDNIYEDIADINLLRRLAIAYSLLSDI